MSALPQVRQYIEKGWKIIPLAPRTKIPIKGVNLAEYTRKDWTPDELDHLFGNGLATNVGILMGSPTGLVLIDIDTYKNPKLADLEDKFPTGLKAKTPRGGLHLFYATDKNYRNVQLDGIDVKSLGGYAVASPSSVTYTNDDGSKWTGSYEWLEMGTPFPLPPELEQMITVNSDGGGEVPKIDGGSILAQVLANGFSSGSHNQQMKDVARYLYRMGVPENVIREIVITLDMKDNSPQGFNQALATINSGISYEKARKPQEAQEGRSVPFTVVSAADVLAQWGDYDVRFLVDRWIPESSTLMLAAPPENYKTWLGMDMCVAIATGGKFMGSYQVNDAAPVIIIQQEDYIGQQAQRLRTIIQQKAAERGYYDFARYKTGEGDLIVFDHPIFAPIFMHIDAGLNFDNPESLRGLERVIKETGAKMVYIDPLFSMTNKPDDYFAGLGPQILHNIKPLRTQYQTSFVFAHHTRKSGAGSSDRQSIWGSNLLNGTVEGIIIVYQKDGRRFITRSGKFFTDRITLDIDFDINTKYGEEHYIVNLAEAETNLFGGKYDEAVFLFCRENGTIIAADVARALDIPNKTAGETLNRLVEAGILNKQGRKYYVPVDLEKQ